VVFRAVEIRRLSFPSVYKLVFIGLAFSLVPFCLASGIFAFFGAKTLEWNKEYLTGAAGLVAAPFIGVFITLVCTAILGSLTAIGLWIYSKVRVLRFVVGE